MAILLASYVEDDLIPDPCTGSSAVAGGQCLGRLRVESVISDSERVLYAVRCHECGRFYLFDPAGSRLTRK